MRLLPLFTALSFVGMGCGQLPSSKLEPRSMTAQFSIRSQNDGTSTVFGAISSGLYAVKLDDGDSLDVTVGSDRVVMVEDNATWGRAGYTATIPTDEPGTPVTVTLRRAGNVNVILSAVIVSRFALAPIVVPTPSRSSAINLVWDTVSGQAEGMNWDAWGGCTSVETALIPAGATSAIIAGGSLKSRNEDEPQTCEVRVEVSRFSTVGTFDPAWGSGSGITSVRKISNTLVLTP